MSEQQNIDTSIPMEEGIGQSPQYMRTIEGVRSFLDTTLTGHQGVLFQEHMSHILFKVLLLMGIQ